MAQDKSKPCCSGKVRPSQLPIYDDPDDLYDISYEVSGKGQLQEGVEMVRKELSGAVDATKELRDQVNHIYQTGIAHTAATVFTLMEEFPLDRQLAYLREDENIVQRSGAIAAGGVLGLLLGARGRFFRKLIYASGGAGGTAGILYPQHSKQYMQEAFDAANTYSTVAYNFFVGVKPQASTASDKKEATTAPANASLDDDKVEVSNHLYPSLLTLPHSRLFIRREEKNYWPYVKTVKEAPAATQGKSLDRLAEEASQVTTLGFRLIEATPTEGFGSVAKIPESLAQDNVSVMQDIDEEKSDSAIRTSCPVICSTENSLVDKNIVSPPTNDTTVSVISHSVEEVETEHESDSDASVNLEKSVSKLANAAVEATVVIKHLEEGAEKVVNFAHKVEEGAKVVQKASEITENIADKIPFIAAEVGSAAEFVKENALVVEEISENIGAIAAKIKDGLEEVESVTEALGDSSPGSHPVKSAVKSTKEEKFSLKDKVAMFFSSGDSKTAASSPTPDPVSSGTDETVAKPAKILTESDSAELDTKSKLDEPLIPDEKLEPVVDNDALVVPDAQTMTEEAAASPDSEKVKEVIPKTKDTLIESTTTPETAIAVKPEVSSGLLGKISSFFKSDDSSSTLVKIIHEPSSTNDLNNNKETAKVQTNQPPVSNNSHDASIAQSPSADETQSKVVQKPAIPEVLLKKNVTALDEQKKNIATMIDSKPLEAKVAKPDTPMKSLPETESSSVALAKMAPPNISIIVDSKADAMEPRRRSVSQVRSVGDLMIIESSGNKNAFLPDLAESLPEASKNERKADATEDHGQSNPSDADMYTTRS